MSLSPVVPETEAPVDRKILNQLEAVFGMRLVDKGEAAHACPRLKRALKGKVPDATVFLDVHRELPLMFVEVKKGNLIKEAIDDCLFYCKLAFEQGVYVQFALAACATETHLFYFDAATQTLRDIEYDQISSNTRPAKVYNPSPAEIDESILASLYYSQSGVIAIPSVASLTAEEVRTFCVETNLKLQQKAFKEESRAHLLTSFLLCCLHTEFDPAKAHADYNPLFKPLSDERVIHPATPERPTPWEELTAKGVARKETATAASREALKIRFNQYITEVCSGTNIRTRHSSCPPEALNVSPARFHIASLNELEGVMVFITYVFEGGRAEAAQPTDEDSASSAADAAEVSSLKAKNAKVYFEKLLASSNVLGDAYEIFNTYTGGNSIGQYFTPRHAVEFTIKLVELFKGDLTPDDVIYDPACGVGGFLAISLQHIIGKAGVALLSSEERTEVLQKIGRRLFGNDKEERATELAKVNLLLRGDGKSGITVGSALDRDYPGGASPIKQKLAETGMKPTVCLLNPPFPTRGDSYKSFDFIAHAVDVAADGAFIAAIVPTSVINGEDAPRRPNANCKFRKEILARCKLKAVATLPPDLFEPRATVDTAIVVLQKHPLGHDADTDVVMFFECQSDGMEMHKGSKIRQTKLGLVDEFQLALKQWKSKTIVPRKFHKTFAAVTNGADWSPARFIPDDPSEYEALEIERLARRVKQDALSALLPIKEGSKW